CLSVGPFAGRAEAEAAVAKGRALATRIAAREVSDSDASSYRVMLPAVGDREAAQALVKRIAAAGIADYYLISQGEADNAIALGQYRSREGAERRQAALVAAGFPAQLIASGGSGQARWWVDLKTPLAASQVQRQLGAARQRSLDCAALR
ncbi:MAG TPA: hypothetical protein DDZ67_11775, partial [Xanthomonadaceae bacterium]|nr:hypothetical protein [Xanthomonadaceae bacterium]